MLASFIVFTGCSQAGPTAATNSDFPGSPPANLSSNNVLVTNVRTNGSRLGYVDPREVEAGWKLLTKTDMFESDTNFYRWGSKSDISWWIDNGISEESVRTSIENTQSSDTDGGSFYASLNPIASIFEKFIRSFKFKRRSWFLQNAIFGDRTVPSRLMA